MTIEQAALAAIALWFTVVLAHGLLKAWAQPRDNY